MTRTADSDTAGLTWEIDWTGLGHADSEPVWRLTRNLRRDADHDPKQAWNRLRGEPNTPILTKGGVRGYAHKVKHKGWRNECGWRAFSKKPTESSPFLLKIHFCLFKFLPARNPKWSVSKRHGRGRNSPANAVSVLTATTWQESNSASLWAAADCPQRTRPVHGLAAAHKGQAAG